MRLWPPLVSALACVLSACATVPLSSVAQLARIDFMTTDLARMRVAIALPSAIAPQPGGVELDTKYRVGNAPEQELKLKLVESGDQTDLAGIPPELPPGQSFHVFKLANADVKRLEDLRLSIAKAKTDNQGGSLNLGIASREFCRKTVLPAGPVLTTTYVLTSETGSFVTIVRDFDLRSDTKVAEGLATLEDCR